MPTFQTKAEQDQYDKTLAMFGGIPQGLKDLGYASADPLEVASYNNENQVSFLSTENAANTVQSNKNKLDVNYPIKPAVEIKPTDTKPKTAKFVNEAGQIITIDESQMQDPDMESRLQQGGYVFSEGDGVKPPVVKTNKPKVEKTGYWSTSNGIRKWNDTSGTGLGPNGESKIEMDAQEADARLKAQMDEFNNWTADMDPAFQSIASGISAQFESLRVQARKTNESRARAYETLGMRGGTSEFAGSVQMSIEGGELDQANARLAEITRQEQVAIAAAREAYTTGKWTNFNKQIDLLEKQREEKMALLKDYNDKLATQMNDLREKEIQSTRDSAIANLMQQGITDPLEMIDYLNFTQDGQKVGDFTIKEVTDSLTSLSKVTNTSVDKLTGDSRNFFALKAIPNALPSSITSLPESQQLGAYLQWNKDMIDGKTTTPTGKITNINAGTATQADIANLPVSELTKAIMSGYGKVKDLTPTDKAKVLTEMYQVGYNPNTYVMNKLSNLVKMYGDLPDEAKGYVDGMKFWQSSMIPEVAIFSSAQSVLTREIARLNDVGVLSDQDVASYTAAMPSRRDQSLEIVLNKIAGLQSTITQKAVENVGKTITLPDGRTGIISFDGETILDPITGEELK
jgi:hypothetical protein